VAFAVARAQPPATKGLRKNPDDYLYSAAGVKYPGTAETLQPARDFLGEFSLPDETLRQCLVHKSFAHAKFPYNEKLAVLGSQLFRLQAFRSVVEESEPMSAEVAVNGKNFSVTPNAVEVLTSTPLVAKVCEMAGLEPTLFYKSGQPHLGPRVKARAVHALVGALVLEKGEESAIEFIKQRLLSGRFSVFDLANEVNVHN